VSAEQVTYASVVQCKMASQAVPCSTSELLVVDSRCPCLPEAHSILPQTPGIPISMPL
jgi:hypothetical protein